MPWRSSRAAGFLANLPPPTSSTNQHSITAGLAETAVAKPGERGASEGTAPTSGDPTSPIPGRGGAHSHRSLCKESRGSLTQSHSEEQGQAPHGARISQLRSRLFLLSLSLSSKGQQVGRRKSPLRLRGSSWEAGSLPAFPPPLRGAGIPEHPLQLGSSVWGPQSRPALLDHPAPQSPGAFPHPRRPHLSPQPRIHFPENHYSTFPHLCQVPSRHIGVVGKPNEITNKYFNHCLEKIRFKIKTCTPTT